MLPAALALPASGDAGDGTRLSGRATVTDGDTLRVAGHAVRFQGLVTPERKEAGGAAATAFVCELVAGRTIICGFDGTRARGRVVGVCRVSPKLRLGRTDRSGSGQFPHRGRWLLQNHTLI